MKTILSVLFIFCVTALFAQDTTVVVKDSWYIRTMPVSIGTSIIYSGSGVSLPGNNHLRDRVTQNLEVGISTSIMDIGLAYGRLNFRQDTTSYIETRFTLVTFQIQKFSNEFTIGMGYGYKGHYPIMLEVATTMLLQVNKKMGLGLITGYMDFAGDEGDYSKNYYGLFFRFGLARSESGSLLQRRALMHRHKR